MVKVNVFIVRIIHVTTIIIVIIISLGYYYFCTNETRALTSGTVKAHQYLNKPRKAWWSKCCKKKKKIKKTEIVR